ncbi:hypothetical protein [Streptomyces sp. NPDC058964]|uniref:hypothetical protein n=1 Tax=Streptomyces sp. NPDC058964 TaxID=3346681 RepID=UPI0036A29123
MRRTVHSVSAAALVGLIAAGTTAPAAFAAPAEQVDALSAAPQVPSEGSQQDTVQGTAQDAAPGDLAQDTAPGTGSGDISQYPSLDTVPQDTSLDASGQQPLLDPSYDTTLQNPADVLPKGGTTGTTEDTPQGVSPTNVPSINSHGSASPVQQVVIQNPVNNSNEQGSHNVSHDNGNNNHRDEGRGHNNGGGFFPGPILGGVGNLGTTVVALPRGTAGVSGVSNVAAAPAAVVPGAVRAGEGGSIKSPVPTMVVGGALVALGCAAMAHRLWLRRRRLG